MTILEVKGVQKIYTTRFGGNQVKALENVNFSVEAGEYVAIMGESGSGKTTLLNILASLDRPTKGSIMLDGMELTSVKEGEMAAFRRKNLGFVFQEFNLLDTFSIKDNILLPLVLDKQNVKEMMEKVEKVAASLGISDILEKYPYEVSGGQKQRAAAARAIITEPKLLLADEPTGALDSKSTDGMLKIFSEINEKGQTILMVTHSKDNGDTGSHGGVAQDLGSEDDLFSCYLSFGRSEAFLLPLINLGRQAFLQSLGDGDAFQFFVVQFVHVLVSFMNCCFNFCFVLITMMRMLPCDSPVSCSISSYVRSSIRCILMISLSRFGS